MRIAFTFRNLESSDAVKQYATDKIAKFEKYVRAPLEAEVVASLERHLQCVDVTIVSGSSRYEAREESADMYASIDLVIDKLDAQLKRDKSAQTARKRSAGGIAQLNGKNK
jgi:putative sigma-54 modulation protein